MISQKGCSVIIAKHVMERNIPASRDPKWWPEYDPMVNSGIHGFTKIIDENTLQPCFSLRFASPEKARAFMDTLKA